LRPDVLAGAILLRPMVVLPQAATPHSLAGKRVLIASGAHDPIMPADHPEALARLLRAGGAHVTVHTATASHNLVPADLAVAQDFLETR
jgi:predicted esterase